MEKNSVIDEALIANMGNFKLRKAAFRRDVISSTQVSEGYLWTKVLNASKDTKLNILKDLDFDKEELNKLR